MRAIVSDEHIERVAANYPGGGSASQKTSWR
jgi:hypothetical protein